MVAPGLVAMMAAMVLAGAARAAEAQVGPRSRVVYSSDPSYWVGLSLGFVDGTTINDGDTGSSWRFGYAAQLRATLEKTIQRGITIGAGMSFADAPLTYVSSLTDPRTNCISSCLAKANITQLTAFVHGGGRGYGFHPVYDLEAGFTEFSNFHVRETDSKLAPLDGKYDFTFGFGGGLGYAFSQTTDFYIGEMVDLVLHPANSSTTTSSAPRLYTFRAGLRVGF